MCPATWPPLLLLLLAEDRAQGHTSGVESAESCASLPQSAEKLSRGAEHVWTPFCICSCRVARLLLPFSCTTITPLPPANPPFPSLSSLTSPFRLFLPLSIEDTPLTRKDGKACGRAFDCAFDCASHGTFGASVQPLCYEASRWTRPTWKGNDSLRRQLGCRNRKGKGRALGVSACSSLHRGPLACRCIG